MFIKSTIIIISTHVLGYPQPIVDKMKSKVYCKNSYGNVI